MSTPIQGWWRILYVLFGLVFVGLGGIGAFLPGLPTTPFLLLASYFFARSSPRLNAWMLRSRIFGGFLRDWQKHHGIRKPVKVTAVLMVGVAVTTSATVAKLSLPWLIVLILLGLIGVTVILCIPTIRATENPGENLSSQSELSTEQKEPKNEENFPNPTSS